jgi:hypothetical protein
MANNVISFGNIQLIDNGSDTLLIVIDGTQIGTIDDAGNVNFNVAASILQAKNLWVNASVGVSEQAYVEGDARITGEIIVPAIGTDTAADFIIKTNGATKVTVRDTDGAIVAEGGLEIKNAGKKLKIKEGANAIMGTGTVTFISGSVTINTTAVETNSRIILTPTNDAGSGAAFVLYAGNIVNGTSFDVTGKGLAVDATFNWLIISPA